jgi:catechol 2,3-dioxygenase-like lactoylglutathione lyase family enzyme
MLKALAHVCFRVRDLDASIDFYVGKLGMEHAFDFINDQGERFGVYLHVGGRSFVELFRAEPGEPEKPRSWQHICLEVEDVKAAVQQLRAAGLEVTDPNLGSDGSWQAWLQDPDGNRIELHSYTPESKQLPHLRKQ